METELFNEKTIKRLCSNVKITQKQKKNADEWIKLLESGSLTKERANYFKFALYVLKDILGYSIREDLDYEKSNIEFTFKDSIGKTILCIEVKGESKNLFSKQTGYGAGQGTPFKQTWDNMGRIDSIKYGICTNYKDFILIDKSKGYSKYHFFDFLSLKANPEKLKEFIGVFSKESIIDKEFIEILYEKSIIEEREFTKQFYKLFHETRLMLIKEFQDNGANRDESIHFTQIFLNRLIFVFFAEDTGKLKQRLFEDMVLNLLKVDSVFSEKSHMVCNLVKSIFENLNEGSKRHKIFGFNGGLFKEQIPEKIYFRDFRKKAYFNEIYQHSTLKKEIELDERSKSIVDIYDESINPITLNLLYMASFDFNTEVSVNILGHIFEQSISDLEELKQEKVLRRKKEGVYYTPNFITDYICRNTIIPYLSKKGVDTVEKLIDEYADNIDDLEGEFKQLKILDPACGSGSFLLKAIEVLLEIYKQIQIVKQIRGQYAAKKVTGLTRKQKRALRDNLQLSFTKWHEEDEAREIIENNIYGVDINEESVEITKLSLFFKIVKKNKQLIDLSKNIKCGDSLIDDLEVVGNKAFNWEKEFPFKFDIIIGNPPYVRQELLGDKRKTYFSKKYPEVYNSIADLYVYFYALGLKNLKENGFLSYISSNKWIERKYGFELRKYLKTFSIQKIVNYGELKIFQDASTEPLLIIIKNNCDINKISYTLIKSLIDAKESAKYSFNEYEKNLLSDNIWKFTSKTENTIIEKFKKDTISLSEYTGKGVYYGIKTGLNEAFIINKKTRDKIVDKDKKSIKILKSMVEGDDFGKWYLNHSGRYMVATGYDIDVPNLYPEVFGYLEKYKDKLLERDDKGEDYWNLRACNYYSELEKPKIIYYHTAKIHNFYFDKDGYYISANCYFIANADEYLQCILNSNLFHYVKQYFFPAFGDAKHGGRVRLDKNKMVKLPIKLIGDKKPFEKKAKHMTELNGKFQDKKIKFINRCKQNLMIYKITKKLDSFYEIDFKDFLNELQKQKIQLNLKQQDEWEDYFNSYKKELISLHKQINEIDKEINQMVYKLYGLTKEEIEIVEESLKE